MRLCSRNNYISVAATLVGAASLVGTAGCTEVDDRLGTGLIPKNQRMEIEVTSPGNGIKTYLYRADSVISSRTGSAWFGRTNDLEGVFGAQTSGVLLQFQPYGTPYEDAEGYGLDPIIDSAVILFTVTGTKGDTTQVQRFDVWEVDDSREAVKLHRDSSYYSNFDAERVRGRKLFEFSHTGKGSVYSRLFPTAAGRELLNELVTMPWVDYMNDSLFSKRYRGFVVAPAEGSPTAAALYGTNLLASGFQLHVRNHDTLDRSAIYDTLSTLFTFSDASTTYTDKGGNAKGEDETRSWASLSVNMTKFDYTGSVLGTLETQTNGFTDTLPTSPTQPLLYVQSMGGVGGMLRFTDELIEEIRSLRLKIDQTTGQTVGKDLFINQAMMGIWVDDDSVAGLDGSMARMGCYLKPQTLAPIPDYQYATELYRNQLAEQEGLTETYTLPYNGYLNRSNGYYEMDITSYVQQLAKEKPGDPQFRYLPPVVYLAPEAYGVMGAGQSVLRGFDSDKPVSIRITYAIIEG
ncbi:MAG: DUF4270 domain-containing protein [Alistipes sp.]|jgi:hypothetical protein|nr:DUF4270 domain-containing protein [Alistipes sp.]